jgi:hypothetical protein
MNDKTRELSTIEAQFKAHECRELATRATQDRHRVMLEHMAETWERIAQEIPTEN